jgi:hypothetical protein
MNHQPLEAKISIVVDSSDLCAIFIISRSSSFSQRDQNLVQYTSLKKCLQIGWYRLMVKNHIIPTQLYSPNGTNPTLNNFLTPILIAPNH